MTLHYQDDWLTVYLGDCREVLAQLPAESVHCVVTSPPYWGLRDYGTATWTGGEEDCDHVSAKRKTRYDYSLASSPIQDGKRTGTDAQVGSWAHECPDCGAIRQDRQLGLEPTPEEYVSNMVAVFREVRRVLRRDGTVWLNVGDSYASSPPGNSTIGVSASSTLHGVNGESGRYRDTLEAGHATKRNTVVSGLKPKDLVGIPWRLAFALQADGWYLRSDVIWSKPNPMPESVTDRPTKAHEYVFLLSREARYYYDADAVREPHIEAHLSRYRYDFWPEGTKEQAGGGRPDGASNTSGAKLPNPAGRNLRSVWTIATQPYPGAHFATFPQALVEPCVKAGTSERGVCPACGSPWRRVVEDAPEYAAFKEAERERKGGGMRSSTLETLGLTRGTGNKSVSASSVTTGWQPTCAHDAEPVAATVLDPFAGSGTTALVANRLSRRAVLVDLSADYLGQVLERNRQAPLGLAG